MVHRDYATDASRRRRWSEDAAKRRRYAEDRNRRLARRLWRGACDGHRPDREQCDHS